ncbi:reverse transcriptase domain-containing protein, partial [Tanacetum coccineum]
MIRAVQINVPLVDVLAGMPNYGKFLKELVNNKHKIEQIFIAFLRDESSAILQNKVPPKLRDPESFLIPCNFNKAFSCNALADLGASINLMPYSLYAKLSLETLKPTKISVILVDQSFQYPVGIAENMLVKVGKFTFPADFVIFQMEEDNFAIKYSYSNDDTSFNIDVIDENLEEDFDALLDEGSEILHSIEGTILKEKLFAEFDEFMAMTADENSKSEFDTKEPPFKKITFNTDYKIKTSLEEPPTDQELKHLPDNLEYVFLEEPSFLPVIISSQLSEEDKNKLISIDHMDQEKTTFTCPFGTYAYRRMPFGLCNALATFQRCMLAIFHDMIEESVEQNYTITEKELMAVVFAFDKFRSYMVLSKTIVHTDHSALRHLFKKQDAKPCLIHWILLLQEFDIEIKDRKSTENVAADHLSRIKKEETSDDSEVDDNFLGETLMEINTEDEPWFADFANYLVSDIIPKGMTYQQKNKFFSDIKHYFWEEPYLFK